MRYTIACFVLFLALVCMSGTSCSKEDSNDKEKPVISISLPQENDAIILAGDSVHVMINITDNENLKSFTAELKTSAGTNWFTDSRNVDDLKFYTYHRHYNPIGLSGSTSLVLTATAVDKAGNTESKTVNFSVAP